MRSTIVCLANSYKHGGRCVAGIDLQRGVWVRLRSADADGSLAASTCRLAGADGDLRPLDVFEATLDYAMPADCHPEDWVAAPVPWRMVERPCSQKTWEHILPLVPTGSSPIKGYRDRIRAREIRDTPLKHSLALIQPDHLWWWVREERGKRKCRCLFQLHHVTYDFAVTDPHWLDAMNLLPAGLHPHHLLAPKARETWLTISLSEVFAPAPGEEWHFKLVAAVLLR